MASNLLTINTIASEALHQLSNNLVAAQLMYRDKTGDFGMSGGYKVGDSVNIRTNPAYDVHDFAGAIVHQQPRQSKRSLTIDQFYDVSIDYTSRERALDLDSLSDNMLRPAMIALADKIDRHLLSTAWEARGMYQSLTPLTSAAEMATARKVANKQQIAQGGRIGIVNSDLEANLLGTDTFHRFDARAQGGVNALENATMGKIMGVDWYSSVNFTDSNYAPGTGTGSTKTTPTGTENQIGTSTLYLQGTSVGTFEAGDRIQIAGMFRPLVVAAQVLVGGTAITLTEEIDEVVPVTAAITVIGSGNSDLAMQGLILEPGAFAYAMPPLDAPRGGVNSSVVSMDGLSLRAVEGYSQDGKTETISFDCILGASVYDSRKAMVIAQATA